MLINADSDTDMMQLLDGTTLTLASLATRNLNVRADFSGPVLSVKFTLDGKLFRIDSTSPYSFAGDRNGDYYPWTPSPGKHTLVGTPYPRKNAAGTAGKSLTVTFTVN